MLRRYMLAVTLALALALPGSAAAQEATGLAVEAAIGTGFLEGDVGVNVGLGGSVRTQGVAFRLLGNLHLVEPDDDAYGWDVGTGGAVCRDEDTGQEVSDGNCSISGTRTGIMADASLRIPAFLGTIELGAGYRMGEGSTPYGTAGYGFHPRDSDAAILFRGVLGDQLVMLQAIISLPVGL